LSSLDIYTRDVVGFLSFSETAAVLCVFRVFVGKHMRLNRASNHNSLAVVGVQGARMTHPVVNVREWKLAMHAKAGRGHHIKLWSSQLLTREGRFFPPSSGMMCVWGVLEDRNWKKQRLAFPSIETVHTASMIWDYQ
jgi:hypothetical protein